MTPDVTGILSKTNLLRSVPAEDLSALAAVSRQRTFGRGQVVFTRGDPGDSVIVVVSGRVKVVVRSADGGALTLAIIGPGGVFGELGVADGGPGPATPRPWTNASCSWSRARGSKRSARGCRPRRRP